MDDTKIAVYALLTLVLVVVAMTIWSGRESPMETVAVELPKPIQAVECGVFVDSCRIKVSLKLDRCEEAAAEKQLHEMLGRPLEMPECRDLVESLGKRCRAGCSLDASSILTVPGRILLKGSDVPDESGRCNYTGLRQVSVRASCQPS